MLGSKWVVLIAGSTGSALRAVRPPNFHITPDVDAIWHDLDHSCRSTEKPDDLVGDIGRGRSHVDCQRVLTRIRFFESVDLASQQRCGHEMAVTSFQMLGDQVPAAAQID